MSIIKRNKSKIASSSNEGRSPGRWALLGGSVLAVAGAVKWLVWPKVKPAIDTAAEKANEERNRANNVRTPAETSGGESTSHEGIGSNPDNKS